MPFYTVSTGGDEPLGGTSIVGVTRAGLANLDRGRLADLIDSFRPRFETAQDLVLAALREAIILGILPPGTKLRQEDLASTFGTSRIPVREALRALTYEGLVSSEPYRGFRVTALPIDEIEEIYELRAVIEGHAAQIAVSLLTDQDLSELDSLYTQMSTEEDPDRQLILRERFYLRLYAVTGRRRLGELIVRLRQEVARSLRWKLIQHSPTHHEAFWQAIRDGNGDRAAAELTSHYRKVTALIRRFLREPAERGS
jgi:DNA-binding GntR family transcriptional regulator